MEPSDVSEEELEAIAQRIRSIRRRELRARMLGTLVALGLGVTPRSVSRSPRWGRSPAR